MEKASRKEVIKHWCEMENINIEEDDEWDLCDKLDKTNPLACHIWSLEPINWYYLDNIELSTFKELYVVNYPKKSDWFRYSEGDGFINIAKNIDKIETDDINVKKIIKYEKDIESSPGAISLNTAKTNDLRVIDGNHRYSAVALRYIREDEFINPNLYIASYKNKKELEKMLSNY